MGQLRCECTATEYNAPIAIPTRVVFDYPGVTSGPRDYEMYSKAVRARQVTVART